MEKNFLQKIIDKIFEIQENFLQKKYKKKRDMLEYSENSMVKNKITQGVTLNLSTKLEEMRKQINEEVKKIAKENSDNLVNLLEIAKKDGAKIYVLKNPNFYLKPIGETEGFIFPKKGISALYLNLLTSKKFSLKTGEIFIFENEKLNIYALLYNFYLWYSYKKGLPGFDDSMLKIKNLEVIEKEEVINNLKYEEIMKLKQSIAREQDAMKFVMDFMKETEGGKNAFNNLKDNGANI